MPRPCFVPNPPFWLAGITNQVRIFLAVGSLGTGLLAWRALQRNAHVGWFYASFGWLGIAAGFRPIESTLLLPLLLWVWARSGRSAGQLTLALRRFAPPSPPLQLSPSLLSAAPTRQSRFCGIMLTSNSRVHRWLFGARSTAAFQMVAEAIVWNFLAPLAWIWALPSRAETENMRRLGHPRAFSPRLVSPALPLLCTGSYRRSGPGAHFDSGPVSLRWRRSVSAHRTPWDAPHLGHGGRAVAVCSVLFFLPPRWKLARASSYRAVASIGRITDGAISAIDKVSKDEQAVIIDYGFLVSYRQIAYYFPDDYVVFLPGVPASPSSAGDAWVFHHHKFLSAYSNGNDIVVPPARKILFLLPQGLIWAPRSRSCRQLPARAVFSTPLLSRRSNSSLGPTGSRWEETRIPANNPANQISLSEIEQPFASGERLVC